MSVVEFKKKKHWDANNVLDCLEITKHSIQKAMAEGKEIPDSILIIPCWDNHVQFHIGGKEMSSTEVLGTLDLVKIDIALGGGDE